MASVPRQAARTRADVATRRRSTASKSQPRNYSKSVFINCPFDTKFEPIFDAFVFTIIDCGFVVRCALEVDNGAQIRFEKIVTIISQCALSVHDLSRTQIDRKTRLPRFNMPLELGLFLGALRFGSGRDKRKSCIIFDTERYRYRNFISDIAGQDIKGHGDVPKSAIPQLRNWLSHHARDVEVPSGVTIVGRFQRFKRTLPKLCQENGWDHRKLEFHERVRLINHWIAQVAP